MGWAWAGQANEEYVDEPLERLALSRPLVLRGGRVIDPSQGLDRVMDVAFADGKVVGAGEVGRLADFDVRDVSGKIVTPGLIDLHTHVYWAEPRLCPVQRGHHLR